jgi:hypothetical protein
MTDRPPHPSPELRNIQCQKLCDDIVEAAEKHFPLIRAGGYFDTGDVASVLSQVLGSTLATVKFYGGQKMYVDALEQVYKILLAWQDEPMMTKEAREIATELRQAKPDPDKKAN